MKPGEKVLAIIFLIFSIVALYLSYNISGFKSMSSPGSFPMIVSLVLLISAILIVRDVFKKNSKESSADEEEANTLEILFPRTVIIFMLASLVYVFLIIKITFIYASLLYIMFIGLYFKDKKFKFNIKEIIKIGIISVGTTIAVYFIFQEIFNVILP